MISNFVTILSRIKKRFPFLHRVALFHLILLVICLAGMLIDDRQLLGISVWTKPAKFAISGAIFLWTVAWYLTFYPFGEKTKTAIAATAAIVMAIETPLIVLQGARGVQSHYNMSTPLDGIIFAAMGIGVAILTLIVGWFFIKSFSKKLEGSATMKWSYRIAWFTFLFASLIGNLMIGQMKHNVGVPDGGAGLPFVNWSTLGGDLRVAHFFGIHGIQVIPFFTFYFSKQASQLRSDKINNTLTNFICIGFAALYLFWVAFTFFQAQAGQPFFLL